MAIRLSEAFGTTAEFWLNVQRNYDLWHAEKNVKREQVTHFWPLPDKESELV
ncbi:UNVERIFIED_CONTAM: hypothetical protein GTU68_061748 [Idotea baltica]|nr:hypothetical protein [Idotea baltica]